MQKIRGILRDLTRSPRVRRWVETLAFVLFFLAVRSSIASAYSVPTASMVPTFLPGDRFFATQFSYGLRVPFTDVRLTRVTPPERGDIVVFPSPREPDTDLVKRVAAVGGDVVEVRNGRLLIDGVAVDVTPPEPQPDGSELAWETLGATRHRVRYLPRTPHLRAFGPLRLPPGHFLALGDNRDDSADGRVFGPVPYERLRAKGQRLFYSLDTRRFPFVRFERTGAALR